MKESFYLKMEVLLPCYTTLYDIDENYIKVRYGKIVKGDYVETYDENKKIIRTLTT